MDGWIYLGCVQLYTLFVRRGKGGRETEGAKGEGGARPLGVVLQGLFVFWSGNGMDGGKRRLRMSVCTVLRWLVGWLVALSLSLFYTYSQSHTLQNQVGTYER